MAAHTETGNMLSPVHYNSKVLNHLGLVSGMYDELGIGERIDILFPQDKDRRII